jgi:putative transposase
MIEPAHVQISIARQCDLVGLARSTWYEEPAATESNENLLLMRWLDEQYTKTPFYGIRRMKVWLEREKHVVVNRKRVSRLLRLMGLEAIYPKPRLSQSAPEHTKYPYLLRNLRIDKPGQVWCSDITYIRLTAGFVYLVAVLDWFSRYIVSWELSNTLDESFCVSALERALRHGRPEIFNTDQGSQFTGDAFTSTLKAAQVRISMDGVGRCLDNVFVERFWRTLKYEEVYLKDYTNVPVAMTGLSAFMPFYNDVRPHQSLGYLTPAEVHFGQDRPLATASAGSHVN